MLLFLPHATNALTLATRTPRAVSPKMATVDMPPPPGFVWAEDLNDTPSPEVGVVVAAPAPAAAPATTGGLPDGLTLDTLTEASALALEGSDLEAVAQALRVYLFKSPPFMEKQQQPKRPRKRSRSWRQLLPMHLASVTSRGKLDAGVFQFIVYSVCADWRLSLSRLS